VSRSGVSALLASWVRDRVAKGEALVDTLPQYGRCQSRVVLAGSKPGTKEVMTRGIE
jgi:hypothetical protein